MRKHLSLTIAGLGVLTLIMAIAVVVLSLRTTDSDQQSTASIVPGHWWTITLTEQEVEILGRMWGSEVTATQLIRGLRPEILEEVPGEGISALDRCEVCWPAETMEIGLKFPIVDCAGRGLPASERDGGSTSFFSYFVGVSAYEHLTLGEYQNLDYTTDTFYRISIYTDEVCGVSPAPDSSADL